MRNRRSPSPMHHRRSPSPMRRRRSPSPVRRKRSPFSMRHRRSPSPIRRRRSPSPTRPRKSPSPTRSRRSPSLMHDKSPIRHRPLSPSTHGSLSPMRRPPPYKSPQQRKTSPLHSPRINHADSQVSLGARKRSRSPYMSSSPSNPARRDSSRETDRRTNGFDSKRCQDEYTSERVAENAAKRTEKQRLHKSQGRNGKEEQASPVREDAHHRIESSSKKVDHSPGTQGHPTNVKLKQNASEHNSNMDLPARHIRQVSSESLNEMEYDTKHLKRPKRKQDTSSQSNPSDLEGTDMHKNRSSEKRKHKKYDKYKKGSDDSSESDSDTEAKKEAKRRRKEERRLRKEERRRKREEKHQKRLERRASKLKMRPMDTVMPPSDFEKEHSDAGKSDDEAATRKSPHKADTEETESEEKQLEIKLREKALESLRARKATSH
ncbi:PWI [Musa troglodytarum]|uniref:PWI n=1 Tax=Musa troglodytarum TaxID=320322 RepID=A0A9E7HFZ3_9LILI|nr:PWI [Musa troglodytarum]